MATGCGGQPQDHSVCPVCLKPYNNPKFLPCYHTLCAACVQSLVDRHPDAEFPCPLCQKATSLPADGVDGLQTNYYINTVKKTGNSQDLCKIHTEKILEFTCLKCDKNLCLNCKLTEHEGHRTTDISAVAKSKRPDLLSDQDRLERAVSTVRGQVDGRQEELLALQQKKRALETNIERRHQLIVNIADAWKEETFRSLRSVTADIEDNVSRQLTQRQRQLDTLLDIQRHLQHVLHSGTDCDVIAMSKEMKSGRGSPSEVDKMMSQEKAVIVRPVLQFKVMADVLVEKTRGYLGSVGKMEMTATQDDVTVEERFMSTEELGQDVFSLCHIDEDPPVVHVSYDNTTLLEQGTPMKIFSEKGERVGKGDGKCAGRLTVRRIAKGEDIFTLPKSCQFSTFSKSVSAAHFRLHNFLTGRADIVMANVLSTDPLKVVDKKQFSINVGPHRAFDVDETEQQFAMVEEAKPPAIWRTVRLYRLQQETSVATYSAPTATFQPSDVCFYELGGQPVLLITDELNDAIHVVNVQDDRMTFQRYLCAGCPLLVQPTAINVDVSCRIWVACRGGKVLTLIVG